MPNANLSNTKKKIQPIQDIAIMLTGASEFLCEKRMLKRLSAELEYHLEELENSTGTVKKNFDGITSKIKNLDSAFSKIRDVSRILKSNNADLEEMCSSKNLGKKLTECVFELKNSINDMETTFHKKNQYYSKLDRITKHLSWIKPLLGFLFSIIHNTLKIILVAAILAIGLSAYLFLTMESKDTLINDIRMDRTFLNNQISEFERKRSEYRKISEKIESIKETASTRQDKIGLLDLIAEKRNVQKHMEKTLLSIKIREKRILEKSKKLEEINRKSFLQRFLKR